MLLVAFFEVTVGTDSVLLVAFFEVSVSFGLSVGNGNGSVLLFELINSNNLQFLLLKEFEATSIKTPQAPIVSVHTSFIGASGIIVAPAVAATVINHHQKLGVLVGLSLS